MEAPIELISDDPFPDLAGILRGLLLGLSTPHALSVAAPLVYTLRFTRADRSEHPVKPPVTPIP